MRRLLKPQEVADKLGRSVEYFMRTRHDLFRSGFPRPVFGDQKHGRARWDEGAIDAWLDSRMDPSLRAQRPQITNAGRDWQSVLAQRLERMA